MSYNLNSWPELEWAQWSATAETLQMYLQIVGKTRLALTPLQNHWGNTPLYLTARGLWTSPMLLHNGDSFDIEFDFLGHALVFRTSGGERRTMTLEPKTVKAFFEQYRVGLRDLDVGVHIDPMPVEVASPIPFHEDEQHRRYDPDAAFRFWHALRLTEFLLSGSRPLFSARSAPSIYFGVPWISQRRALVAAKRRHVPAATRCRPKRTHMRSSARGFGREMADTDRRPFTRMLRPGLSDASIPGPGIFNQALGEFILNYKDVVHSLGPLNCAWHSSKTPVPRPPKRRVGIELSIGPSSYGGRRC